MVVPDNLKSAVTHPSYYEPDLNPTYRDLGERPLRSRGHTLRELREIRIDMARFNDELSNTSKFFGDWHLARIYMGCAARFHLAEWENMVSQKLRALDGLYTMLQQDSTSRALLLLDAAIVGLFVIDLVVIIVLGLR